MTQETDGSTAAGARDIVARWLGDGFANQAGTFEVREDADPELCKDMLTQLCRYLTAGEIRTAEDAGLDVSAVFKAVPKG
jgi:hypothetical protein